MKSPNYALRKAYYAVLQSIANTYYQYAPESETGDRYIIFQQVSNTDASTFNSADTFTTMQVKIYTKDTKGNAGSVADSIADSVLQAIYPSKVSPLTLTGFQISSTSLVNDNTETYDVQGTQYFVNRIITFRHQIFQTN
jgi:hypothetical protein